ncbi:GH25 family lysozyme [Lactococcus garvieae]|uniref:GH25 family lysozyme n=1 Tax=Lactococcus garvieae TaxID=1363 RepID=A0AA43T9N5_9LACT|nr:GH25 family lysozyme [Lactococcus garvieae]MDH7959809.1 GH25 family lysozyme [Lactococcus garvieae]BDM75176.1 hypothetical protein LGMS210922A_01210 [Lactococcus garvieae]BDW50446.1 hypothetical protein LG21E68_01210 [Lactococcus garvieae]
MINLRKAAVFTGLCFIALAAHAAQADTAEVPVDNHPMGYYAEVQTEENPMTAPIDAQGNLAPIDEEGQTVKEDIQKNTETPKVSSRVRRAIADDAETAQASLRNAPSDLVSNDTSLPRKDAVDIASWQDWMTQSDFNQLKAQGVKAVIVKLTESTTYINPAAKAQIQMAKNAGLTVAVYHFSHFSESGKTAQATVNNTARAEANFFANVAKQYGLSTSTVMINDAEYVPKDSVGTMPYWDWTVASQNFADQLKKQGFATTRHYASKAWAVDGVGQMEPSKLGAKNLWIAQYLYGKPSASNLQNTQFGSWQYTSQMYFTNFSRRSPLDVSIDYANIFAPVNPPAPSGYTNIYRLYNNRNLEHLYTKDANEKDRLPQLSKDWKYEGVAWKAPKSSSVPVYRVYDPRSGEHLYTKDAYEVSVLTSKHGWRREGVAFYSDSSSATPAYRLYNPAAGVGAHFITMDSYEKSVLVTRGWKYEGIAWYGQK